MHKNDQAQQLYQRKRWIVQQSFTPFTTKNKKQESISDLVMLTNTENDSVNSNTNHEVKEGIVQNTIFNRCIEDIATAMVVNNRFTTKSTFNIRPEGKKIP